jgi:hypothetical protein
LGLSTESVYIKQIYIRNKHWNPEPAPPTVEDAITAFDKALHGMQQTLILKQQKMSLQNLTYSQSKRLRTVKESNHLIIKPTDKNLGPAIMDTDTYIKQVHKEHLLTSDYEQLSNVAAKRQMYNIEHELKTLIMNKLNKLSKLNNFIINGVSSTTTELQYFMGSQRCTKSQSPSDQ